MVQFLRQVLAVSTLSQSVSALSLQKAQAQAPLGSGPGSGTDSSEEDPGYPKPEKNKSSMPSMEDPKEFEKFHDGLAKLGGALYAIGCAREYQPNQELEANMGSGSAGKDMDADKANLNEKGNNKKKVKEFKETCHDLNVKRFGECPTFYCSGVKENCNKDCKDKFDTLKMDCEAQGNELERIYGEMEKGNYEKNMFHWCSEVYAQWNLREEIDPKTGHPVAKNVESMIQYNRSRGVIADLSERLGFRGSTKNSYSTADAMLSSTASILGNGSYRAGNNNNVHHLPFQQVPDVKLVHTDIIKIKPDTNFRKNALKILGEETSESDTNVNVEPTANQVATKTSEVARKDAQDSWMKSIDDIHKTVTTDKETVQNAAKQEAKSLAKDVYESAFKRVASSLGKETAKNNAENQQEKQDVAQASMMRLDNRGQQQKSRNYNQSNFKRQSQNQQQQQQQGAWNYQRTNNNYMNHQSQMNSQRSVVNSNYRQGPPGAVDYHSNYPTTKASTVVSNMKKPMFSIKNSNNSNAGGRSLVSLAEEPENLYTSMWHSFVAGLRRLI